MLLSQKTGRNLGRRVVSAFDRVAVGAKRDRWGAVTRELGNIGDRDNRLYRNPIGGAPRLLRQRLRRP